MKNQLKCLSGLVVIVLLILFGGCSKHPISQECVIPTREKARHMHLTSNDLLVVANYWNLRAWDLQEGKDHGGIELEDNIVSMAPSPNGFMTIDTKGILKEFILQSDRISKNYITDYGKINNSGLRIVSEKNNIGYLTIAYAGENSASYYQIRNKKAYRIWRAVDLCLAAPDSIASDGNTGWYVGCGSSELIHLDANGKIISKVHTGPYGISSIVLLKGDLIAAGGELGTIYIYNRALTQKVKEFKEFRQGVWSMATDSTGSILVAVDIEEKYIVWEVDDWKMHGPFHEEGYGLAFLIDPDDSTKIIHWIEGKGICRSKLF